MEGRQISADEVLDQALRALVTADAEALGRLERAAPEAGPPVDRAGYLERRLVFQSVLDGTGRNLRFLMRVLEGARERPSVPLLLSAHSSGAGPGTD